MLDEMASSIKDIITSLDSLRGRYPNNEYHAEPITLLDVKSGVYDVETRLSNIHLMITEESREIRNAIDGARKHLALIGWIAVILLLVDLIRHW
jgi:hypothetical protein